MNETINSNEAIVSGIAAIIAIIANGIKAPMAIKNIAIIASPPNELNPSGAPAGGFSAIRVSNMPKLKHNKTNEMVNTTKPTISKTDANVKNRAATAPIKKYLTYLANTKKNSPISLIFSTFSAFIGIIVNTNIPMNMKMNASDKAMAAIANAAMNGIASVATKPINAANPNINVMPIIVSVTLRKNSFVIM
jgi:hypothetical protein